MKVPDETNKDSPKVERQSVIDFPIGKVATNLFHQLDHSHELFDTIKIIGRIVEEEDMSESAKKALEETMEKLLKIGMSISDEAFQTGVAVKSSVRMVDFRNSH